MEPGDAALKKSKLRLAVLEPLIFDHAVAGMVGEELEGVRERSYWELFAGTGLMGRSVPTVRLGSV